MEDLNIDMDNFVILLKMSFGLIQYHDIPKIVQSFKIGDQCKPAILEGIYYISRCFNSRNASDKEKADNYILLYKHGEALFNYLNIQKLYGTLAIALFQKHYQVKCLFHFTI